MSQDLILGTAGHIDHGKTALIKALTGVDCDRLPEEQQRGITIDIGFARLDLGEYHLGVVDVPGHERFIRNMLAGATGIDLALLVVAVDDSVMPQTREHLEILQLLGLRQGVIAVTKCDLADSTSREVVALEIRELTAATFLEKSPLVFTSTRTGEGLEQLRNELAMVCREAALRQRPRFPFRLPIDRAFVVQGHGTVVTGSVVGGSASIGDELDWHRGNGVVERVRVRGLNHHGMPVEQVHSGQRAAINLAAVPCEALARGQELSAPDSLVPSRILTVELRALPAIPRPLKHRLPARLHIGTAELTATVVLLDVDQLESGRTGLAQLFLTEPVTAVWGQPFILRSSSAEQTLGGGKVLQPHPGKIRRRDRATLERIGRLTSPDTATRAEQAAWFCGHLGVTREDLIRSGGVELDRVDGVIAGLLAAGKLVDLPLPHGRTLRLAADLLAHLADRMMGVVDELHEQNPLMTTQDRQAVATRMDYLGDALPQAIIERLIREKRLIADGRRVASAAFKPILSLNQRKLKDRIVSAHATSGLQPPDPKEFASLAGGNAGSLPEIYEVAVAEGFLVRVTNDLYLHSETDVKLRQTIIEYLGDGKETTVSELKDVLGVSRKYAVPLCEYLDRIGLTRRIGDRRVLNPQAK